MPLRRRPARHANRGSQLAFLIGAVLGLLPIGGANAEEASIFDSGVITAQVENDLFANLEPTDRHYTNGVQLTFLSAEQERLPGLLGDLATLRVPLLSEGYSATTHRIGFGIGHAIFTPENITATALQPNDRPYAAWLHATLTLQTKWSRETGNPNQATSAFQDQWKIDVGIVGPAAQGERVQNTVHEIIDSQNVNGWNHQLPNEVGLNVSFERAWNSPDLVLVDDSDFKIDAIPYAIAAVGNIQTYVGTGAIIRIGQKFATDFGPPRIYPGFGGSEAFNNEGNGFSWYLFAGAEGRLVGRDMFLDGTLFSSSHSVDRKDIVGDFRLGAVLQYDRYRLSVTQVQRTREFFGQPHPDMFGAITLGVAF